MIKMYLIVNFFLVPWPMQRMKVAHNVVVVNRFMVNVNPIGCKGKLILSSGLVLRKQDFGLLRLGVSPTVDVKEHVANDRIATSRRCCDNRDNDLQLRREGMSLVLG